MEKKRVWRLEHQPVLRPKKAAEQDVEVPKSAPKIEESTVFSSKSCIPLPSSCDSSDESPPTTDSGIALHFRHFRAPNTTTALCITTFEPEFVLDTLLQSAHFPIHN